MQGLNEKLHECGFAIKGLQLQLKARDDSVSGPHIDLQKSSIVLFHRNRAVASLYYIPLGLHEQLQKSNDNADGLHAQVDLQASSKKENMTAFESTNPYSRAIHTRLTGKDEFGPSKLQREL